MKLIQWLQKFRQQFYLAGLVLGGALLLWQLAKGLRELILNQVVLAAPGALALGMGLVLATNLFQMLAWGNLMGGLGVKLSLRQVISGYALTFLPRYIPGTIWGYLSRGEWLKREAGVGYAVTNLGSVLEMVLILCANAMVIGLYLFTQMELALRPWFGLVWLAAPVLVWAFVIWVVRIPWVRAWLPVEVRQNPRQSLTLGRWLISLVLLLGLWLPYGIALGLTAKAFYPGLLTTWSEWALVSAAYSVAWLVGFFIVFVPAGMGFRELALATLLTGGLGLAASSASLVSVLFRLMLIFSEIIWVFVGLFLREKTGNLPDNPVE